LGLRLFSAKPAWAQSINVFAICPSSERRKARTEATVLTEALTDRAPYFAVLLFGERVSCGLVTVP